MSQLGLDIRLYSREHIKANPDNIVQNFVCHFFSAIARPFQKVTRKHNIAVEYPNDIRPVVVLFGNFTEQSWAGGIVAENKYNPSLVFLQ